MRKMKIPGRSRLPGGLHICQKALCRKRHKALIRLLRSCNRSEITYKELAEVTGLSDMTIRRIIDTWWV